MLPKQHHIKVKI